MFFTIKKKTIFLIFLLIIAIVSIASFVATTASSIPKPQYKIVIDAGHGGRDGGAVGKSTGITESELNLEYALQLKDFCEEFGFEVVLTRSTMDGLYDENSSNKKKSEMENRINTINNSDADLMISLHMNAFPLSSSEGAQVFYAKGSGQGYELAKSIQTNLSQSFKSARDYVTVGDYFVLNFSNIPSVLVECGFLSNPEEEKLLQDDSYKKNFCYSLLAGIINYFDM